MRLRDTVGKCTNTDTVGKYTNSDTVGEYTKSDTVGKQSNSNSVRNTLILSESTLIVLLSLSNYTNSNTVRK